MRRTETPKPIWIKFCMVVDIPDVVTCTNFGDHRLRGFWVAGVKFPPLPLTFIVALTTLSHYRASVWWLQPVGDRSRQAHFNWFSLLAYLTDNESNKLWDDYISRYIVNAIGWFRFEKKILSMTKGLGAKRPPPAQLPQTSPMYVRYFIHCNLLSRNTHVIW